MISWSKKQNSETKTMSKITFQDFLQDKFNELDEIGGMPITKDNFESMSENWFERLDVSELIEYGEEYGRLIAYETASDISDAVTTITLKLHDEK